MRKKTKKNPPEETKESSRGQGKGTVFSDLKKKKEMLSLRKAGYSYPQITAHYEVDHTTIIYHCKRAELFVFAPKERQKIVSMVSKGCPVEQVAKKFKMHKALVKTFCRQAGVPGFNHVDKGKKLILKTYPRWRYYENPLKGKKRAERVYHRTSPTGVRGSSYKELLRKQQNRVLEKEREERMNFLKY